MIMAILIGGCLWWAMASFVFDAPKQKYTMQPSPGELWVLNVSREGPWPTRNYYPVTVIDVSDGWVLYAMGRVFPDNRLTIKDFLRMYRPYEPVAASSTWNGG